MKLIIIDGGPASGKNTLGDLLVEELVKNYEKAKLLDLDVYVEQINPNWIWENKQQEIVDQEKARENWIEGIKIFLQSGETVIAIGERFLSKSILDDFIDKLGVSCPIFLYHLSVPFLLRKQRLHQRGPHSLIDLDKDQNDRDAVKVWPGYVYENVNSHPTLMWLIY